MAFALAISKQMEITELNKMNKNNNKIRSNTMRRYIYLFAILSLFVVGCSEESVVNSGPSQVQNDYRLIKLPAVTGLQVNNIYSDSKQIDGSVGGTLSLTRKLLRWFVWNSEL